MGEKINPDCEVGLLLLPYFYTAQSLWGR